jgi:hypothetical protein
MALYAPVSRGNATLVAGNESKGRVRAGTRRRDADEDPRAIARGQSPEPDDSLRASDESESDIVMIPSPPMLGIKLPGDRQDRVSRSAPRTASTTTNSGVRWQLKSRQTPAPVKTEQTDLNMDGSVDFDPFSSFDDDGPAKLQSNRSESREPAADPIRSGSKDDGQLVWRPVKSANP